MTGTHGRPEIVIEGSHHIEGPWREIEFTSKPGKVSKRPRFISPHHPRLDMQMYYAAEGTYQQNPFFLSLVYHLMQNTTEVVNLIEDYPFKNRSEPMRFARAKLYMYHFTDIGDKFVFYLNLYNSKTIFLETGGPAASKKSTCRPLTKEMTLFSTISPSTKSLTKGKVNSLTVLLESI